MPDRKKSLSIFSFNKKQKSFLKGALVFFIPVIAVYVILEILVSQVPFNYVNISKQIASEGKSIKIITTGSSQMMCAVNPQFFDQPAINFASNSQHHKIDYNIITQTKDRLESLDVVVLELSYSHLEIAHNSKFFWKNNVYLKYYNVNNFERNTYFKDKLIFLSEPEIYSKVIIDHYIKHKGVSKYNRFGFDENKFAGLFEESNYEEDKILKKSITINTDESSYFFENNTEFLYKMLDYLSEEKLNVIVTTLPMHRYYLKDRNPNILKRRDSILELVLKNYNNVRAFRKEEDSINFITSDFKDHNHLNPRGAEKFTTELNTFIKEQFPN
ncbi:MAG: hypothetical protein ACI9AT_002184 [Ulvibacter sp.]|jgi:hypothetical protein